MIIIRSIVSLLACFLCISVLAMDISAEDQYVAVDQQGQRGRIIFRLQHEDDHWYLQAQTAQGEWENVSCESGCELTETSDAENEALLGASIMRQASVSCLQNQDVAFCRLSDEQDLKQIYALVIRSGNQPAFVRLERFSEE